MTCDNKKYVPVISVVMPCFNVARTLKDAIESVLEQTFQDFEIILINDGSTDLTPEICESYAKLDARITVVHQPNAGLASARNTGLRCAQGKYIALLDSDDLFVPEKLARHVEHLESNPRVGVSFSYSRFISDKGEPLRLVQGGRINDITAEHVLCRNPVGNGSAAVIRRAALSDIKPPVGGESMKEFFDSSLRQSEDVEFWFRMVVTTTWKIAGIDLPLTLYRLASTGLSADTANQLLTWERFLEKAQLYAPELVLEYHGLARAFQYRYLARRSIQSGQIILAAKYMYLGLCSNPRILVMEPIRTGVTIAAVIGLTLVTPFKRLFSLVGLVRRPI